MIKVNKDSYYDFSASIKISPFDVVFYVNASKSEDKDIWYGNIGLEFLNYGFGGKEIEELIEFEIVGSPTTEELIERSKKEIVSYLNALANYVQTDK